MCVCACVHMGTCGCVYIVDFISAVIRLKLNLWFTSQGQGNCQKLSLFPSRSTLRNSTIYTVIADSLPTSSTHIPTQTLTNTHLHTQTPNMHSTRPPQSMHVSAHTHKHTLSLLLCLCSTYHPLQLIFLIRFLDRFCGPHLLYAMVNFMGQLDRAAGCPDIWLNMISCVCEGVLDEISNVSWTD